jgi:hypothetical protein
LTAVVDEREKNNDKSIREELAEFIPRDRASCEECKKLLRETSLVVEMSNVGKHVSGFIRFENNKSESAYESHLSSAHGLMK